MVGVFVSCLKLMVLGVDAVNSLLTTLRARALVELCASQYIYHVLLSIIITFFRCCCGKRIKLSFLIELSQFFCPSLHKK